MFDILSEEAEAENEDIISGSPPLETDKTKMADKEDNPSPEIAQLKKELSDALSELAKFKEKDNSETELAKVRELEDLKIRAEDAESQLKELRAKEIFSKGAADAKAQNANKLYSLVSSRIEYTDKGEIKNLKEVFEQAKKDYPEEFGAVKNTLDGGAKDVLDREKENLTPYDRMRSFYESNQT